MKAKAKRTRYVMRNAAGEELVCPSLADLHALYAQGFLTDDDFVRQEGTFRWIPVASMPALHGLRENRADRRKVAILLAAALALVASLAVLVHSVR
jgi:hypothetical protein